LGRGQKCRSTWLRLEPKFFSLSLSKKLYFVLLPNSEASPSKSKEEEEEEKKPL
jgi:hypothetical protein